MIKRNFGQIISSTNTETSGSTTTVISSSSPITGKSFIYDIESEKIQTISENQNTVETSPTAITGNYPTASDTESTEYDDTSGVKKLLSTPNYMYMEVSSTAADSDISIKLHDTRNDVYTYALWNTSIKQNNGIIQLCIPLYENYENITQILIESTQSITISKMTIMAINNLLDKTTVCNNISILGIPYSAFCVNGQLIKLGANGVINITTKIQLKFFGYIKSLNNPNGSAIPNFVVNYEYQEG